MSGTLQRGQSVIAGAVPVTGDPKHMTVVMLLGPSQRPQTLWWDLSWSAAPPPPPLGTHLEGVLGLLGSQAPL